MSNGTGPLGSFAPGNPLPCHLNGALRTAHLAGRGEEEEERGQRADPQSRVCLTTLGTVVFCAGRGSVPTSTSYAGQESAGSSPPGLFWGLEMICCHTQVGNKLFVQLFPVAAVGVQLAAESRYSTECSWRQVQAKDCTESRLQQSLKTSLFCTRVVCSDCKVSLQSSSRAIIAALNPEWERCGERELGWEASHHAWERGAGAGWSRLDPDALEMGTRALLMEGRVSSTRSLSTAVNQRC